jgi:uncharacterized protein (TIGR00290 family)
MVQKNHDRSNEVTSGNRLALSWSSGKDSAAVLRALIDGGRPPEALLTTFTEGYERVSMHGVRRSLVELQATALGIKLVEVTIPPGSSNDLYEARLAEALNRESIDAVAFGDLFLEDVRVYRERLLEELGKEALFPLWRCDTRELARRLIAEGLEAVLTCVDPKILDASFAGRRYDAGLLADLPPQVDPCGENGEFHTFVYGSELFEERIACEVASPILRDGFAFCDVLPRGLTPSSKDPSPLLVGP